MAKKGDLKNRIGEKWKTNSCGVVEIIEYFGSDNCTVKFSDGEIRNNIIYRNIRLGKVAYPIDRLGEQFISNQGCSFTIIEYFTSKNITIMFEDGNILKNLQYDNIKNGKVANLYYPSVCGVGYIGTGKYKVIENRAMTAEYSRWRNMIKRCYDEKRYSTYKDVTVCKEWHNYQNFAQWYVDSWKSHMDSSWHLDKDILVKGNKVYSPETCCFVPQEINTLFVKNNSKRGKYPIGVSSPIQGVLVTKLGKSILYRGTSIEEAFQAYKIAKESYIKELANKWKPLIKPNTYQALYNYQIEITD